MTPAACTMQTCGDSVHMSKQASPLSFQPSQSNLLNRSHDARRVDMDLSNQQLSMVAADNQKELKQLKKLHAFEKRLYHLERDSQRMQKREMRKKLRKLSQAGKRAS